jgi:hypothetical protein
MILERKLNNSREEATQPFKRTGLLKGPVLFYSLNINFLKIFIQNRVGLNFKFTFAPALHA